MYILALSDEGVNNIIYLVGDNFEVATMKRCLCLILEQYALLPSRVIFNLFAHRIHLDSFRRERSGSKRVEGLNTLNLFIYSSTLIL